MLMSEQSDGAFGYDFQDVSKKIIIKYIFIDEMCRITILNLRKHLTAMNIRHLASIGQTQKI